MSINGAAKLKPYIPSRVDGHILICSDSSIRWLSLYERLQYHFKIKTASDLDKTPYPKLDNSDLIELLKQATKVANEN